MTKEKIKKKVIKQYANEMKNEIIGIIKINKKKQKNHIKDIKNWNERKSKKQQIN